MIWIYINIILYNHASELLLYSLVYNCFLLESERAENSIQYSSNRTGKNPSLVTLKTSSLTTKSVYLIWPLHNENSHLVAYYDFKASYWEYLEWTYCVTYGFGRPKKFTGSGKTPIWMENSRRLERKITLLEQENCN